MTTLLQVSMTRIEPPPTLTTLASPTSSPKGANVGENGRGRQASDTPLRQAVRMVMVTLGVMLLAWILATLVLIRVTAATTTVGDRVSRDPALPFAAWTQAIDHAPSLDAKIVLMDARDTLLRTFLAPLDPVHGEGSHGVLWHALHRNAHQVFEDLGGQAAYQRALRHVLDQSRHDDARGVAQHTRSDRYEVLTHTSGLGLARDTAPVTVPTTGPQSPHSQRTHRRWASTNGRDAHRAW